MLITDRNPKLAAKATPLECIEDITKAIAKGYEKAQSTGYVRICKVSPLDILVHSDLTYSKKNCEWYHDYYNELQDISRVAGIFIIPDLNISAIKVKTDFQGGRRYEKTDRIAVLGNHAGSGWLRIGGERKGPGGAGAIFPERRTGNRGGHAVYPGRRRQ